MKYLPDESSFVIEVTVVPRRSAASDAFIMPSKICQFPPTMDIAPSVAIQTIVSRPWI